MYIREDRHEKILWSIALPGFGQILNGQPLKGVLFIALELIINVKANINNIIMYSFNGNIKAAIEQTDYEWLLFYPCVYIFAIYDAYSHSKGTKPVYAFVPFVSSAFLGTIGVIYSPTFRIRQVLFGPIWLSLICFVLGAGIGHSFRLILKSKLS